MNDLLPLVVLVGPLVGGVAALALVRWSRVVGLTGTAVAGLLWLLLQIWFDGNAFITLWGYDLILTEDFHPILTTVYAGAGLLFFITAWLPQGIYFVPATLFALVPLALTDMVQSVSFGAFALLVAICILMVAIQGDSAGDVKATLRYLIMFVLAIPLFIVADWFAGHNQLISAEQLFLLGALVLSAGFPFYIWVRPLVLTSPPLNLALVFGLVQLVVVYFEFSFLQMNMITQSNLPFTQVVQWSGCVTILIAIVIVVLAADWRQLWAGLLLVDMGLSVLALVVADRETAVALATTRFVSLTLGGLGFAFLTQSGIVHILFAELMGKGRQYPVAYGLLGYGFLSLVGLPVTFGFYGHWSLVTAVAQATFPSVFINIFVMMSIGVAICVTLWRIGQLWVAKNR